MPARATDQREAGPAFKRTAIYLRVSSNSQSEKGLGIELQAHACHSYIKSHPELRHVETFEDRAYSGGTLERPSFQKLLKSSTEHRYDVLLIYRYDRLARDLFLQLLATRTLESNGVRIISVTEQVNGADATASAMRSMLGIFSELDKNILKTRMMAGKARKLALGGYCGGGVATGYSVQNKKLVINEGEAEIVRIARRLRMGRNSYAKIAAKLTAMGYKPRRAKAFSPAGIHYILKNRVYSQTIRYGGAARGTHPAIR